MTNEQKGPLGILVSLQPSRHPAFPTTIDKIPVFRREHKSAILPSSNATDANVLEEECRPVMKEYLLREEKKKEGIMNRIKADAREDSDPQKIGLEELKNELMMIRNKMESLDNP